MVTLSNGSASMAEGLLERAGVGGLMERLMSVEHAGAWKPHPSSYMYALNVCGVAAGEAMMVAVHPWDIDGASRAGLSTAWMSRSGADYPGHFRPPTHTIRALPELAALLAT